MQLLQKEGLLLAIDYDKIPTNDLIAMKSGKYDDVSTETLLQLKGSSAPEQKFSIDEAELGSLNRARYSLEPIQSNREALLKQEFGAENIISKDGELYVKQQGAFRPVNAPGLGLTDVAEIGGALPEIVPEAIGGLIGGGAGVAVGAPTGPGAIATGAVGLAGGRALGGALGSGFRQALSAAAGTPQVATLPERAAEVGMSAITAPIGGALADVAGPAIKRLPGIRSFFEPEQVAQEVVPQVARATSEAGQDVTQGVVEQVIPGSDQFSRPMIQQEFERLSKIAQEQGLPAPTYAQAASGKAILAEQQLMDTPLIGSKIRKRVDQQLKAVKDNLEKEAGAFLDADSTAFDVGLNTRKMGDTVVQKTRQAATDLYDQIDQLGANASIGKKQFFNKFRDYAGELGLIKPDLSRAEYDASVGLTRETFNQLQNALFDGLTAIGKTKSPTIKFDSINAIRQTVRDTATELGATNRNASRLLKKFSQELNETAQRSLDRESPRLGGVFKEANKTYAKYLEYEDFISKTLPEGKNEATFGKRLLSNPNDIVKLKEIIGEERVKEIGASHVRDILADKLKGAGVARANAAINELKKIRQPLIESIGEKSYKNLIDNLDYLNRTNQPLIPNRASLYSLFNDSTGGLKGFAARVAGAGKAAVESGNIKPAEIGRSVRNKIPNIPTGPISRSNIGNILTTQQQTEANQ